jgi:hypothetical protein
MQSTGQQRALPEKTGTVGGASKIHLEEQHSSDNKVEPSDTALPADNVKSIDTETQTDAVMELTGLQSDKKDKIKKKKHRWLAYGQSQLHDEPRTSSFIQQELVCVSQKAVAHSSTPSSPLADTVEKTCASGSVSNVSAMHMYCLALLALENRVNLPKFM